MRLGFCWNTKYQGNHIKTITHCPRAFPCLPRCHWRLEPYQWPAINTVQSVWLLGFWDMMVKALCKQDVHNFTMQLDLMVVKKGLLTQGVCLTCRKTVTIWEISCSHLKTQIVLLDWCLRRFPYSGSPNIWHMGQAYINVPFQSVCVKKREIFR